MIRIFMIGMSTNKGGVETYINNLCEHISSERFEVIYSMPEMIINGQKWIRPENRHNFFLYEAFWKRFYRENHFDVVYFNTCDVVSIDQLKFAKFAGVPVRIIHAHSTGNQQGVDRKMSLFHQISEKMSRKTLHQYATHYFACSKVAGDWMFDGREYRVIQNGISVSKYCFSLLNRESLRKSVHVDNDAPLVGVIGRLTSAKNPIYVIETANQILEKKPNARVIMIGDGELRDKVEAAIQEKSLQGKVILTGAVNNVHEWMSAIDCLMMPSLFEGLPFVLIEAQAAGIPCVVSDTVSAEANITGLVEYVSLNEDVIVWADRVIEACSRERVDVSERLTDAGYTIENSADTVSKIIETALMQ